MPRPVPPELYDEIISYLWKDSQRLKACSLASKVMVVPSQRRLFHRIALHSRGRRYFPYTVGTSANFSKLLTKSPHIAGYVRSLFIFDAFTHDPHPCNKSQSIDPLDAPMVAYTEAEEGSCRRWWLPQDKYLPEVAPLLCNLRALTISYNGKWRRLSVKVFNSLVHIMHLPSLIYVQLEHSYPEYIFDLAMGENVKHLSLWYCHYDEPLPIHQPSHLPSGPLRIESLSTQFLEYLLRPTLTRHISTCCLRKVVLQTHDGPVTQAFLESCDALEDLKIIVDCDSSSPVIHLDKLTTMTRFTASLGFAHENYDGTLTTNMPYLRQELLSGSTSGNHALREITIEVSCYYGKDYYSIAEWKEIFGTLDRYSNLEVLNITIGMHHASGEGASKRLFDLLDTCDDVGRLRTEKNVDVRVCQDSSRDEAVDWSPWRDI